MIPPAAFLLIEAVPVIGVLFFGWELYGLMLLFWAENIVVGFWRISRLLFVAGPVVSTLGQRMFLAVFFSVHYGLFCFVHLVILRALFGSDQTQFHRSFGVLETIQQDLLAGGRGWALLALMVGYGMEFARWLGGPREGPAVGKMMGAAYGRIVVLHITLIVGGFLVHLVGAPRLVLLVLVGLKILFDRKVFRAAPA